MEEAGTTVYFVGDLPADGLCSSLWDNRRMEVPLMTLVCCQCGKSLGPDVDCVLVSAVDPIKSSENAKNSFAYAYGGDPKGHYQWTIQGNFPIVTKDGVYVCAECIRKSCPAVIPEIFPEIQISSHRHRMTWNKEEPKLPNNISQIEWHWNQMIEDTGTKVLNHLGFEKNEARKYGPKAWRWIPDNVKFVLTETFGVEWEVEGVILDKRSRLAVSEDLDDLLNKLEKDLK